MEGASLCGNTEGRSFSQSTLNMDPTRTISELKSTFIRSQVRILSENLELPADWRNYAVDTEEGDLSEKVIDDVLHKGTSSSRVVPVK